MRAPVRRLSVLVDRVRQPVLRIALNPSYGLKLWLEQVQVGLLSIKANASANVAGSGDVDFLQLSSSNSASTAYARQIILDSPATMKFANNAEQAWVPQGFYLNSTTGTPRVDQATVLQAYQNHPETNLFVTAMVQGDTNYDGQVNMVDAILNLKVMAGGSVNGEDVTPRADVNGDGSLGMPETLYIMKELSN